MLFGDAIFKKFRKFGEFILGTQLARDLKRPHTPLGYIGILGMGMQWNRNQYQLDSDRI
jgi:hypothetical protein